MSTFIKNKKIKKKRKKKVGPSSSQLFYTLHSNLKTEQLDSIFPQCSKILEIFQLCSFFFRLKPMKQYTTRCHAQIKLAVKQKAAVWTNLKWCASYGLTEIYRLERLTFLPPEEEEKFFSHQCNLNTAVYWEKGKRRGKKQQFQPVSEYEHTRRWHRAMRRWNMYSSKKDSGSIY